MTGTTPLPGGFVTFVFTDIEGSTKMFRQLGDAFPAVLDAHNTLLREQWKAFGGAEVNTAGDSFIVAFASAADALAASVAAQRAVAQHDWPDGAAVRIRIGVHSGFAFPRQGDYVALALHQAARVVGAANGGQVLASDDAVQAAGDDLRVRIEPVGAFRLRDFERPVRLSAVLAPDQRIAQPVPVRAVPADGHNLVPPLTSFVGRAEEVGDLRERLRPGRVLTIVGAGGMGKTRLAVEVGVRVAAAWPDGVWMVDLSTVSDERLVATAVADTVGAAPGDGDEEAAVVAHLERRAALLILDNCEHVLTTSSRFARTLLTRCPNVGVLATSRLPLACAGEELWRIEPLAIIEESVRLFVDRARSHVSGFELAPSDHATVSEICRKLDGMPLAIELAAARVAVLSPTEILAGLDRRFRLLRTNDPTAAPRQRSMQALLDWGHSLLEPAEQAAVARLSIFSSSFDLETAAAAVGDGDIDPDDVPELVWSLADKSLLNVDRTSGGTRYRMLETVRAYAAERLIDAGGAEAARAQLASRYLERLPWAQLTSPKGLSYLGLEIDNIAGLVDGLLEDGQTDDGLALARMIALLRAVQGRYRLALGGLEQAIALTPSPASMLARAHLGAALIAAGLGRLDDAVAHHHEAALLIEQFGPEDRWGRLSLARAEANIALRRGPTEAILRAEHLLRAELEESLSLPDRTDTLFALGEVVGQVGEPGDAISIFEEVVHLARVMDDEGLLCNALCSLAEYALRAGDTAGAARHQGESLHLAAEMGAAVQIAFTLIIAARMAAAFGGDETAVLVHSAADVMLEEAGFELLPDDRALSDEMRAQTLAHLGSDRYAALTQEGTTMSLQDAVELAEEVFERATVG